MLVARLEVPFSHMIVHDFQPSLHSLPFPRTSERENFCRLALEEQFAPRVVS